MTDDRFIELVALGYSSRQMAVMMHRAHSSAQARARRLGVKFAPKRRSECRICGETDPTKFGRQKERCRPCWAEYKREKARARRRQIVEALGGKCSACGFDRFLAALQVHHLEPAKKSSTARGMSLWTWERVARELEHCILLCANCHAGLHHGEHEVDADPPEITMRAWNLPPVPLPDEPDEGGRGLRSLSDDQVLDLRTRRAAGERLASLAVRFGISQQSVSKVALGQRYADGPWPLETAA